MDLEIWPFESRMRVRRVVLAVLIGADFSIRPYRSLPFHLVVASMTGGGLTPYGGLPPPPTPPSLSLLPPSSSPVAPAESAQRLDIFSFSHMRRYYQHHAAQQFDAFPPSPSSTNESAAGVDMGPTPTPQQLTGIMALRTVGKLAGTVKEQLEAERAREGEEASEDDERLRDAQMKSGIGLPLARMFAE